MVERLDTAKGLTPLRAAIEAAESARWNDWPFMLQRAVVGHVEIDVPKGLTTC